MRKSKAIVEFISCVLTVLMFAGSVCAEEIFTDSVQIKNYILSNIAATDNVCIASAKAYLTKYEDNNWSDAVYVPETGYEITDIHAVDDEFYMLEYNKNEQKGHLLQSIDGIEWNCLTEYNVSEAEKFMYDTEGNILVRCEEGTVLPNGFNRYTGSSYAGTFGDFSVEFQGQIISVDRTGKNWYSVTEADGTEIQYPFSENRSNDIMNRTVFTIDGVEYQGKYPTIDSQYYVFSDSNKYYRISTTDTGRGIGEVFYFETDGDGKVKRDENGKIIYTYIECPYAIADYLYSQDVLYVEFVINEGISPISEKPMLEYAETEWYYTTDLENFEEWTLCDKPMRFYDMAEQYNGMMKIRFGDSKIFDVQYENTMLENSLNSNMIGTLYKYYLDDEYFYLSKDGIYYITFELPKNFRIGSSSLITEDGDDFVIQSGIYQLRAPKDKVYSKLEAETAEPIYVVFNDNLLAFEQAPTIESDRTLIPIRFLFEQMGATVDWNGDTQTATISQNDTAITFAIDNTEADINGQTISMDVPARLINGKTMVPVRFLSENLGYDVDWDGENRIITVSEQQN